MPSITVKNVPDEVHRALQVRAATHGRSTEAEILCILENAVQPEGRIRSWVPCWPKSAVRPKVSISISSATAPSLGLMLYLFAMPETRLIDQPRTAKPAMSVA